MKRYSLFLNVLLLGNLCQLVRAGQGSLQPNATVATLLQGSVGKSVELH
jgi:hypothetical protein